MAKSFDLLHGSFLPHATCCAEKHFASLRKPVRLHYDCKLRLQLHDAIYRPDSFIMMLRYCANLKAIRHESMSLNRIVADKSHRVIVA